MTEFLYVPHLRARRAGLRGVVVRSRDAARKHMAREDDLQFLPAKAQASR